MNKNAKKFLALVLALVLAITACCGFTGTDVEIDVGELDGGLTGYVTPKQLQEGGYLYTLGAAKLTGNGLQLSFTGDALEFKAYCEGSVWAKLDFSAGQINQISSVVRYAVFADGKLANTLDVTGRETGKEVEILTGLEKGVHTVKIVRATQENVGSFKVQGLLINGNYLKTENTRSLAIDFYGDSITVGYGTDTIPANDNWVNYSNGTQAYAFLTAEALKANYNIFAYAGIGFYADSNGNTNNNMMKQLDGFAYNKNADVTVINLGTNDLSQLSVAGGLEKLKTEFVAFLQKIREQHPGSAIVLAYGMMNDSSNMKTLISHAVTSFYENGDGNIYSVQLPKGTSGGDGHPNTAQQAAAANVLTPFLQKVLYSTAGDANGDGSTDLKDVLALVQNALGSKVTLGEMADISLDGKVDLKDAALTAQVIAGWNNLKIRGAVYQPVATTVGQIKDYVKLHGRTVMDGNNIKMDYAGTGFEIRGTFKGDVEITTQQNSGLLLYGIVDGDFENAKEILAKQSGTYKIAENLTPGIHNIRLLKATDCGANEQLQLTVTGLSFNGKLTEKPADANLYIEVIGDSVTSGCDLYKKTNPPADELLRQNVTKSFAELTAQALGADVSIISKSGGSAVYTKGNTPAYKLAGEYYKRALYGNLTSTWDFETDRQPDIVVISLGTNDEPGTRDDRKGLMNGMKKLMAQVRAARPNATIVWGYEIMATGGNEYFQQAVEEFAAKDGNTYYWKQVRGWTAETLNGHPLPESHIANANSLAGKLAEILKTK